MAVGGILSDFRHGTNGAVGVLTNFTNKMRNATISSDAEEVDSTVFGDGYRQYEQSFKEGSIEAEYKYDPALYQQLGAIYNAGDTVSFQLSPDGTASGKPKITGQMIMKSFGAPVSIGELITCRVQWRISGAIVWGTHA